VDDGGTWQTSALGDAREEIGSSGNYWRNFTPVRYQPPVATEETRDCGATWISYGDRVAACLGGSYPGTRWRAGAQNATLFAEGYDAANAVAARCTSVDGGQTWLRGPPPTLTPAAIRGAGWFACLRTPAPVTRTLVYAC
jgi:hypothetical protein